MNEPSQASDESVDSPLYLQKVAPMAFPDTIPTRPIEWNIGTSRLVPTPTLTGVSAQPADVSVPLAGATIPVLTEMVSLLEAI